MHTGLFGTNETFVPVQGAEFNGDRVTLAYDKAQVKDAPNISEDGHLSPEEEKQLYRYYGIDYGDGGYDEGRTQGFVDGDAAAGTQPVETAPAARDRPTGTATGSPTTPRARRRPRHLRADHRRRR